MGADASTVPSGSPGMGARPRAGGGVAFRVWAPYADAVAVTIDAADSGGPVQLAPDGAGLWSADVPGGQAGQAYQFLVTMPGSAGPDPRPRVDPYARLVRNAGADADAAVVYDENRFDWPATGYPAPDWRHLVIYELHVGTFDPAAGETSGTLADVADKLAYLQQLGVTAVELMPVAEYAGSQSWGYDPGAPFAVESSLGGPDALKTLVASAHRRGIAVLLDVVYNHLGPDDSILWDFDTWPGGPDGGVYFYPARFPGDPRAGTPWGSRPDYGREQVRAYLRGNARSWLADYRLDGLRFDATAYIRNTCSQNPPAEDIPDGWLLMQQINNDVHDGLTGKITIAEDMRDNPWITTATAGGGAGFDSQWDAGFLSEIRAALTAASDADRDLQAVRASLERSFGPGLASRTVFTESHDADGNGRTRLPSEIDPADPNSYWAKKRSLLGAAVVFSARGIPMIFQGQELLETAPFSQDPAVVDWTAQDRNAGIVAAYRDLIAIRRNLAGHTAGLCGDGLNVFHVNDADKVIAYHRWADGGSGDDVLVICNFANRSYPSYQIGAPCPGTWQVRLNTDDVTYDPSFLGWPSPDAATIDTPRDGLDFTLTVGLGPYTAVVLSQ